MLCKLYYCSNIGLRIFNIDRKPTSFCRFFFFKFCFIPIETENQNQNQNTWSRKLSYFSKIIIKRVKSNKMLVYKTLHSKYRKSNDNHHNCSDDLR